MEIFQDKFFGEIKERFSKRGIKAVLFDLDDTLIYTSENFTKFKNEYVEAVARATCIPVETIYECLERIDGEEYKKMGVNPARWEKTVMRMAKEFEGFEEAIVGNVEILMKIYLADPRVKPGAKAMLEILKMSGVKIGLVTHANVDWTWRKITSVGIMDYFETIVIADENAHKGVECWQEAMENMGVEPQECLVVGDSLKGDIIPSASLGAKTFWLTNGSSWSHYKTGTVPESTINLNNINELLSAVEGLR